MRETLRGFIPTGPVQAPRKPEPARPLSVEGNHLLITNQQVFARIISATDVVAAVCLLLHRMYDTPVHKRD